MKKKYRIAICLSLTVALLLNCISVFASSEAATKESFVLNPVTGEVLSNSIDTFSFNEKQISFSYMGRDYSFALSFSKSINENGVNAMLYSGLNGRLACNILAQDNKYCIQVMKMQQTSQDRKIDTTNNFTVLYGDDVNAGKQAVQKSLKENQNVPISTRATSHHVFVNCAAGGMAEGWCNATSTGPTGTFYVNGIRYNVSRK